MLSKRAWAVVLLLAIGVILYFAIIYAAQKYRNGVLRYRKNVNDKPLKVRYIFGYILGLFLLLVILFIILILYMRGYL